MSAIPRPRPGPLRWIAYAYGRPLPASMREWVRHDLLGRRAFLRHIIRSEVLYVPVFIALLLLPGPFYIAFLSFLLSFLLSVIYSIIYMEQNRMRRLQAHGLPGDLESVKAADTNRVDRAAYEATYGVRE